ncbi:tyrosine-type recombinase/integrase [Arsukibacterium indicum]|uniref:Integrase family protein n=1 Tax=Arsukibacterium indicum TaxID=2848612 RepID=A0ABS6MIZ8_9GAMM|nr:integrase family protein [Arsukibacterium indicum]MBV2128207.1 integrase family protein [Arsukibacterium indicum]
MALSDTWLKGQLNKVIPKPIEKADRDGLSVRISLKGKVTFQMRFRLPGHSNQQRLDLGTYPELTLSQARSQCMKYRAELQLGNDPRVARRMEQLAIGGAATLVMLFNEWYEKYCSVRKVEHKEIKRRFEIHVFPRIGNLPVESITLHEWLKELEILASTYSGTTMSILTNAKQMLKWAVKRRLIQHNVLQEITAHADLNLKKQARLRSLSDKEIVWLFDAARNSRLDPKNALLLELLLFTGCRVGELRQAKKSDFDFENMIWTVPAANHKMGDKTGQPLIRPIIEQWIPTIKMLFAMCPGELVITSAKGSMLQKSFHTSIPDRVVAWLKRYRKVDMESWAIHDLRKTCRTNLSTITEPHIAEIMLGHSLPGVWQTYDRHNYLQEQAKAYTLWWQRLQRILGNEAAGNVVEMKRG